MMSPEAPSTLRRSEPGAVAASALPDWLDGVHHVCFDKDGVLIDVHRYWSHTSRLRAEAIRVRFGLPEACEAELVRAMGVDPQTGRIGPRGPVGYVPRPKVIEPVTRYLAGRSVRTSDEEIGAIFQEVDVRQREAGDYDVAVLPGVTGFLEALRARGLALSVFSSDRREHVIRVFEQISLMPYFSAVVGGGDVTRPKPDPEGFRLACRHVGVEPAQSAYVGDTMLDLRMGRAGGAKAVIGVGTGLGPTDELARETPHVCERLQDAPGPSMRTGGGENATVVAIRSDDRARVIRVVPDDATVRYVAGQYGSLGVPSARRPGTMIRRPYSLSSSVIDAESGTLIDHREADYYEFYVNRVEGADRGTESLTPRLFALRRGDRVSCGSKIVGYYTLEAVPADRDLLLIGSATGESANNALVNQCLRERRDVRVCQIVAAPPGWRSLYEAEQQAAMVRYPNYRYSLITADSYRPLEERIGACLRDARQSEDLLGFALRPDRTHVGLVGDPAMIGAPTKRGAWKVDRPTQGLIPLLAASGFTLSTRFKPGTMTHETYW